MNATEPAYTPATDGDGETFPDSLVSSVGLIPEVESIVNRIREGDRANAFENPGAELDV